MTWEVEKQSDGLSVWFYVVDRSDERSYLRVVCDTESEEDERKLAERVCNSLNRADEEFGAMR